MSDERGTYYRPRHASWLEAWQWQPGLNLNGLEERTVTHRHMSNVPRVLAVITRHGKEYFIPPGDYVYRDSEGRWDACPKAHFEGQYLPEAEIEGAEAASREREAALRDIAALLHWQARRYADGRRSTAPSSFNEATRTLLKLGVPLNETADGTIWARDGMGRAFDGLTDDEAAMGRDPDWWHSGADAREQIEALQARVDALTAALREHTTIHLIGGIGCKICKGLRPMRAGESHMDDIYVDEDHTADCILAALQPLSAAAAASEQEGDAG